MGIHDQYGNPNINDTDHFVGRIAKSHVSPSRHARNTPSLRADVHKSVHNALCIRLVQIVMCLACTRMGKLKLMLRDDSVSTDVHPLDWPWLGCLL